MLSYLLFSRKKRKTVIIAKNRMGAYSKGGLISQNCFTPGGLIERGGYSKLGAYSIIYGIHYIYIHTHTHILFVV